IAGHFRGGGAMKSSWTNGEASSRRTMTSRHRSLTQAVALALLGLPVLAQAQAFSEAASSPTNYARGDIAPAMACSALAGLELHEVLRMTATEVPAAGEVPAHCRIDGTIAPEVTFQVNL